MLTANCIWNSFQNSNKKHIVITGTRGSGKTTLLSRLFPASLPGITTWAEPGKAVYLKNNTSGQISQIGIYDSALDGFENKMRPIGDGFSTLGIRTLKTAQESESKWISIDEIGYLESMCNDYLETISYIMEKKHIVAIIRKQNLSHLKKLCGRDDVFLIDLDNPLGNIGCVIMASGLGTRFGKNKLMTNFCGKPLISHILDSTSGIFQKRIVVTRHKEVVDLCNQSDIDVIYHSLPNKNHTIRLGIESMTNMASCMFCTADQPLLKKDTITSLALLSINSSQKIIRPIYNKAPGSPVIFPQWTFKDLLHLPEGNSGSYIIKQHPDTITYLPITNPYELEDIDTPEDFIRLQKKACSFLICTQNPGHIDL